MYMFQSLRDTVNRQIGVMVSCDIKYLNRIHVAIETFNVVQAAILST